MKIVIPGEHVVNLISSDGCFDVIQDILILSRPTHASKIARCVPQHYC